MSAFISIPGNPEPQGAEAFSMTSADGVRIRAAAFPVSEARGGIILLTGWKEFIEKYFEVVQDFHKRGFSVFTMDWRGQGKSDRLSAAAHDSHIEDFADFRADIAQLTDEIARPRVAGPLFLVTHSMGGAPALQLLADGDARFSGAVLCAPLTRMPQPAAQRALYKAFAALAGALGRSDAALPGVDVVGASFETSKVTTDRRRHQIFTDLEAASPEARVDRPTFGWLKAALAASDDLHRPGRFYNLKTPVLIVSAEKDALVSSRDHQLLAARSPLIECVTIRGALHEIMMERDEIRNEYWRAFDRFAARILGG